VADGWSVGDRVRARRGDRTGHTRLPRYIRGHEGTIVALHGSCALPDRVVAQGDHDPEPVYAVRFDSGPLWGVPGHTVTIELWQSYLEAG
jgi:nitrile hydratase